MRLVVTKINSYYSSETHVMATLLGHCGRDVDAMVLYNSWQEVDPDVRRFARATHAHVEAIDLGYRPNNTGHRSVAAKVIARARFLAKLPATLERCRPFRPDVVYSCQQKLDCMAATWLARKLGCPQVIHLHYPIGPWLGYQAVHRLRACDRVITVSDFIRRDAIAHGVPSKRAVRVYNPVVPVQSPTEEQRAEALAAMRIPKGAEVIGMVGRLDPVKGQAQLVEAFAHLAAKRDGCHLVLVGDGPARADLEEAAKCAALAERIHLVGQVSNVAPLLAAMNVFCHPSREEAFGLAIAEAASAGLPVVAYDEGAVPEIVRQGETGLLVPPGDTDQLAESIRVLLDDPARAQEMGAAGRKWVATQFAPERCGRAFRQALGGVARG